MLEIPESLNLAKQMNQRFRGRKIVDTEAAHTKHSFAWYTGEPDFYAKTMTGCVIGESMGIGSMLEVSLGEYSFVMGDGINLRCFLPGEKLPERYQIRLTLDDGSSLVCTVQMYGSMSLVKPKEYDNPYYLAAKEKPLPVTEDFDYGYFRKLREESTGTMSAKAFLATQQRIPGLGNGVLQDILLRAGLHPRKKVGNLTESRWKQLYETVTETLSRMTDAGGRDTEKDIFGKKGEYVTLLSKNTVGKPCPFCGSIIQKANYLGGTVYFCPSCQEL
ncbi:endonuclease VIII [Acetatifactor muris]|uniref:endonuclease VIII n=1 Tax=Acetatifactor muris TaxID=879566 RepID=UPI00214C9873|nr:endonuclease VIII [Acetatifactor muris]MCR2048037.1 endonuclease VIII [Acetatifactor muris]